jgi:hypothetical protein
VLNPCLEKKWTPAEVSQVLFRRIGDLDGAIQDLLKEDPAKLFRFSQTENQREVTNQQEQSTPLSDLLKNESKKDWTDDYDVYLGTYTGTSPTKTLSVSDTTPKSELTEVSDVSYISEVSPEASEDSETSEKSLKPDMSPVIPDAAQVFKDCVFSTQSILFNTHADMGLLSANDTGLPTLKQPSAYPSLELPSHLEILSGQQTGQQTLLPEQFGSLPADYFGFAAANEDAEPSLDDYFPDIS